MYTYGWFMLRFDRKQQNSVKQLSFNKKIIKKKNGGPPPQKRSYYFIWYSPNIPLYVLMSCPFFRKVFPLYVDNKHSFRYFLPYIFLENFSSDCSPNKNILWVSATFAHYSVVLTMMWKNILSGIFITISATKYMEPMVLSIEKYFQNERF